MRLTKHMKQALVRAVLDDVPREDYVSEAKELVQAFLYSKMPEAVKAVYDDRELRAEYLKTQSIRTSRFSGYSSMYGPEIETSKWPKTLLDKLDMLSAKEAAQREKIEKLEASLKGLVNGVTTRAQLVKAAPELEKYLPAEPEKTRQLPVATGVITNLVEAGWPKGGE